MVLNSISCLSNLTITFIFQIVHNDKFYYMMETVILIVLRVLLNNLANFQIAIFDHSKGILDAKFLAKTAKDRN